MTAGPDELVQRVEEVIFDQSPEPVVIRQRDPLRLSNEIRFVLVVRLQRTMRPDWCWLKG
jgi:hypothetical protein